MNKWSNPLLLHSRWLSYCQQCNLLPPLSRAKIQTFWSRLKFGPNSFLPVSCLFPCDFVVPPTRGRIYFPCPWLWAQPYDSLCSICFSTGDVRKSHEIYFGSRAYPLAIVLSSWKKTGSQNEHMLSKMEQGTIRTRTCNLKQSGEITQSAVSLHTQESDNKCFWLHATMLVIQHHCSSR